MKRTYQPSKLYASAAMASARAWQPRAGARSCRRAGDADANGCPPDGGESRRAHSSMERLRQRADFLAAASGIKVPAAAFVLQARKRRDAGPARFGFTVSKKVGNAVERNRVRRRLREIVRLWAATRLHAGHDYVLVGRRAALNLPFAAHDAGLRRRVAACTCGTQRQYGIAMTDNKNTILAIVLSALVLIGWQYFFAAPAGKGATGAAAGAAAEADRADAGPARPGTTAPRNRTRRKFPARRPRRRPPPQSIARRRLAASPRVPIATDNAAGLDRPQGRAHRRPRAGQVPRNGRSEIAADVLLSPSGTGDPFYAEFGWTGGSNADLKLPTSETVWTRTGSGALGVGQPVTLTYDNGEGLAFRRTIAVDDKYLVHHQG